MGLKLTIRTVLENEAVQKCDTCAFYVDCSYRLTADKFILQCKSFVDIRNHSVDDGEGFLIGDVKGLCTNCSKAVHCTLPKSSSGVWHCEEYE